MKISASWARGLAIIGCALVLGCASDIDTTRERVDTGSFGEVVLTLVCKRMAYHDDLATSAGRVDVRGDGARELCRGDGAAPAHASPELRALQAMRPQLVHAIDAMLPASFLDELQAYVTSPGFLSLYDDGTVAGAMEALAGMLELLAGEDETLAVLERIAQREGYRPLSSARGTLEVILDDPSLPDVLLHTTREIAPGGGAHEALTDLARALGVALRAAQPADSPDAPDRLAHLALDLLLRERPYLGTDRGMLVVLRDERGLAQVKPGEDALPGPFVDLDGDGLADTDELGRFVGAGGEIISIPTPFSSPDGLDPAWVERDLADRAVDRDTGQPVYRYVDLDRTLLAALGRDASALMDPALGTGLDLLAGAAALMGPRQDTSRTYPGGERIHYRGFATGTAPLIDMLHGYLLLLNDPGIYDTLALVRTLLRDHEPTLAQLLEALVTSARAADALPEVALEPGSPFFDDLVPVIREILARPALFEDLMVAMEDEGVAELGARLHDFMTYRDAFHYHPDTQEVVGSFATEVDRSAPASGSGRSIWQRVLHLLDDVNGVPLCNKHLTQIDLGSIQVTRTYEPCELLSIDNLAVFYVRALTYARDEDGAFLRDEHGRLVHGARLDLYWDDPLLEAAVNDEVIEIASGIQGFGHNPTPEALGRALFLDPPSPLLVQLIDPMATRHGQSVMDLHAGTLPAWELNGFYEQIQPLIQPFVDHGAEELFIQLLVTLHRHWPARGSADHQNDDPGGAGYAWASNVAAYEPSIAAVLGSGTLLGALVETMPRLNAMQVNGRSLADILGSTARFFLAPQAGLLKRNGEDSSRTADGREVQPLSIWQILADAYEQKRVVLADEPGGGQAWARAFSQIIDVLGRGEHDADGWRFRNPRLRGVGLALVDFLDDRLRAHDDRANRALWLSRDLPRDLESLLGSPIFTALADLATAMAAAPAGRLALEALVAGIMDEQASREAFRDVIAAAADVLQLAALGDREMVPVARTLGAILDPERGWLDAQLRFALGARLAEGDIAGSHESTLLGLIRQGMAAHRGEDTPLGDIVDGVAEVQRERPHDELGQRLTRDDCRALLHNLARFFGDEKRGMRRFVAVIENRRAR